MTDPQAAPGTPLTQRPGLRAARCEKCGDTPNLMFIAAKTTNGKVFDPEYHKAACRRCGFEWKLPTLAATPDAPEGLDPTEIRDLDMALRHSVIAHDYGCEVMTDRWGLGKCTCPAEGHRNAAIAILKRIGAPYRKPSGDYDPARLARDRAGEPE